MRDKPLTVYGLELAEAVGAIRYVGVTAHQDLSRRLSGHIHAARKGVTSPVYDWIREKLAAGKTIRIVPLARDATPQAEATWIANLRATGFALLNARSGGSSGGAFSEEAKRRLSESNRATFSRPEVRAQRQGENSPRAKLTGAQVLEIRSRVEAGEVQRRLASEYGVHPATIKAIVSRRLWGHV